MSITNELKTELVKFVTVFYQAQASLKELQNLSAVYVSMPTMWVGNNLNALIQARIRQYCKQYESGYEDCGASIDYQTVKEALMQNIGFFDEYDRDADTADAHIELIMQKINHMNDAAFIKSLESEQSKLLDKGKRLIAEKLIESFELDGESCTGKQINIRGNKVTLHTRNPAMWYRDSYCYSNSELINKLSKLKNSISVLVSECGMSNIGSVFHITANDVQALNWDEKLPNGYKAHAVGITTLKVFKEHMSLVISRDDFDAMMSFLITYGKTPIKLNCKEFA